MGQPGGEIPDHPVRPAQHSAPAPRLAVTGKDAVTSHTPGASGFTTGTPGGHVGGSTPRARQLHDHVV